MLYQLSYTPVPRVPLQNATTEHKQAHETGARIAADPRR